MIPIHFDVRLAEASPVSRVYTPEEQAALRRFFPTVQFREPETPDGSSEWKDIPVGGRKRYQWLTARIDIPAFGKACPHEKLEEVTVSPVQLADAFSGLAAVETQLQLLRAELARQAPPLVYNEHANAPVPDRGLFQIRQLHLVTDACTDHINRMLEDGWSIVAVCPQPQRRPDYILGRPDLVDVFV